MIGELAWCDGAVQPASEVVVSAFDRTLLYGLGAFETVRLHGGRPFLLDRHLERLRQSLAAVGLAVPGSLAGLPAGIVELAARTGARSAICRITTTAGPDAGAPVTDGMRVLAFLRDLPPPPPRPVTVGIAAFAHDARSPIAGVKSTSYLVHYMLREQAEQAGRLDDLMVDSEGRVTEGTVSSVFVVRDGRLITPPLSEGILPGVTRGVVLELARECGVPVDESPLVVRDLGGVDECFLTSAGKVLVSADVVAGQRLAAERPVAERLRAALVGRIARACDIEPNAVRF